jgi:hypothetical protein
VSKKSKSFIPLILIVFCAFILMLSLSSNPFSYRLLGHDSSMFRYFGQGIQNGLVPYKDMFDHKGPLLFFINYFAVLLTPNSNLGLWLIEGTFIFITLFFTYKTCLLFAGRFASLSSIFISLGLYIWTLDYGNYSEEYAIALIAIAVYYFFLSYKKEQLFNPLFLFIIAICASAVFLIRANMVAVWVIIYIYILVILIKNPNKKSTFNFFIYSILGASILIIPVILYTLFTNSFSEMLQQVYILNFQYTNSSWHDKFNVTLKFFNKISTYGYTIFAFLFLILAFIKQQNKEKNFIVYLLIILMNILNWYTVIMSGRDYSHYLLTQIMLLTIVTAVVMSLFMEKLDKKRATLIAISAFFISGPNVYSSLSFVRNVNFVPKNAFEQEQVDISQYIKEHTSDKDKIYVHNINGNIYNLSGRVSNSKYFVLPSLDYKKFPEISKDFLTSIKKQPPKYIVLRKNVFTDPNYRFNKELGDFATNNYIKELDTSNFYVYKYNNTK